MLSQLAQAHSRARPAAHALPEPLEGEEAAGGAGGGAEAGRAAAPLPTAQQLRALVRQCQQLAGQAQQGQQALQAQLDLEPGSAAAGASLQQGQQQGPVGPLEDAELQHALALALHRSRRGKGAPQPPVGPQGPQSEPGPGARPPAAHVAEATARRSRRAVRQLNGVLLQLADMRAAEAM